jgi:hypothetical protein
MRVSRRGCIVLGLVALLGLLLGVPAAATAKPILPKDLEKITLITPAIGDRSFAKPGPVTPPPAPVNDYYELLGFSWASSALPVQFVFDPDAGPAGAFAAMQLALGSWDEATRTSLFDAVTTDSTVSPSLNSPDGVNTISFRRLAGYPTALAVTNLWYDPDTGRTMDTDVIFNTKYRWGIDADGEGTGFTLPKGTYDVRNIGTHEIGHVVGLDDLYAAQYRELTMYGYGAATETLKISLQAGDIAGTQYLYGP